MVDEQGAPEPEHTGEAEKRNREALRYLHQCAFLRVEPNKHKIEAILLGDATEKEKVVG